MAGDSETRVTLSLGRNGVEDFILADNPNGIGTIVFPDAKTAFRWATQLYRTAEEAWGES